MLLSGALCALFLMGFWLYCLTDAILTPAAECRGLPKPTWVAVISVTFIGGAIAWLIVRQPIRNSSVQFTSLSRWDPDTLDDDGSFLSPHRADVGEAVARHPAGRGRLTSLTGTTPAAPKGPDDDLEFLRALDRAIRGNLPPGSGRAGETDTGRVSAHAGVGVQAGDEYLHHENVEHEAGEAE